MTTILVSPLVLILASVDIKVTCGYAIKNCSDVAIKDSSRSIKTPQECTPSLTYVDKELQCKAIVTLSLRVEAG